MQTVGPKKFTDVLFISEYDRVYGEDNNITAKDNVVLTIQTISSVVIA